MSKKLRGNCGGDSTEDWGVFDVLCAPKQNCCECTIDIVTTLRSELGALSSEKEHLQNKLFEIKGQLSAKEADHENLRSQAARQTSLIASLQNRLENAEKREKTMQSRCEGTILAMNNDKRSSEDQIRQLVDKIQQLESNFANAKSEKEHIDKKFFSFLNSLGDIFNHNEFTTINPLSPDYIIMHVNELVAELQRMKVKIHSTCHTLNCCENELSSLKKISNMEKQRLTAALENSGLHNKELENRNKHIEREVQLQQVRLTEFEICMEKMKDELRGLESRCFRIQNQLDCVQSERLQFLETLAKELNIMKPCETLTKEKIREILNENNHRNAQLKSLNEQLFAEKEKFKEFQEKNQCVLLREEAQKCELEERLTKYQNEIHEINNERLVDMCDTQYNSRRNNSCRKIRRERTCHDIPLKESSSSIFNLQRRVNILREQIQKRDLQLELVKKKLAIVENSTSDIYMLQNERDNAICRIKKASKEIDKLSTQLVDAKSQILNVKAQLSEAIMYKLTALEQSRKIDELAKENRDLLKEKSNMLGHIIKLKEHLKALENSTEKQQCHDEVVIQTLRKTLHRLESHCPKHSEESTHCNSSSAPTDDRDILCHRGLNAFSMLDRNKKERNHEHQSHIHKDNFDMIGNLHCQY